MAAGFTSHQPYSAAASDCSNQRGIARTMMNSTAMCRQQEAHHLQIALETNLQNVRRVALAAARAWETQALEAERLGAGFRDVLSEEDAAIALEFLLEDETDARNIDNCSDEGNRPSPPLRTAVEHPA